MKRLALAVATALLVAGCGDAEQSTRTAAEVVPALGDRLERVDGLVVDRRWAAARTELRAIITAANRARTSGDLEVAAADRVVASAQRLLAALPAPPAPTPSTPTYVPPADDDDDDDGNEGKGDRGKKAEESAKKAEEEARKREGKKDDD